MDMKHWTPRSWLSKERSYESSIPEKHEADPYWSLYAPFLRMQQDMERMLRRFPMSHGNEELKSLHDVAAFSPDLDILEKDKEYQVTIEVPGVNEKDVHVKLDGDDLIIEGEKKHDKESSAKGYHRIERSYGCFQRVLTLPKNADKTSIKADFHKGLLSVSIAKTQEAKAAEREIEIKTS